MKKVSLVAVILLTIATGSLNAQPVPRPKLVVGIVVDQMRWDYLYRFYDRYGSGGFKRMLGEGFTCENTFIPYAQTITAPGHTCVYTGSVPAFHGIMGNDWYDKALGRNVYCTEDDSVKTIGGAVNAQPQSPRNMWTTTIGDELKLATNFRSKVIGIAIKDRGGILPAGHSADAAYWYDYLSGHWVTSTYYRNELPGWAVAFNNRNIVDSLYRLNWNTLYPIATYTQSDKDDAVYEGKFGHEKKPVFPHELASQAGKNFGLISSTPYGNTMTLAFARAAMENEGLGKNGVTDMLTISLSSPDYVGHQFGPNSIEIEDIYLRLDRDLAAFFSYLDTKVGKGQYLLFLTADHAVAHTTGFLQDHHLPGRTLPYMSAAINKSVQEKFGVPNAVVAINNYQLYLNDKVIDSTGKNRGDIKQFIIATLNNNPDVLLAFDNATISTANLPTEIKERFLKGYNIKRGGDIQYILKAGSFSGYSTGTTHGTWYPYDAHIPLLWMGWGIQKGHSTANYFMTDIAATVAALLHIQMPSGCIGSPIREVMK